MCTPSGLLLEKKIGLIKRDSVTLHDSKHTRLLYDHHHQISDSTALVVILLLEYAVSFKA